MIPAVKYLMYGAGILIIFFVFMLFTQPQNAMHYLEVFVVGIFKVIVFIFTIIYKIIEGIVRAIASLFRRR